MYFLYHFIGGDEVKTGTSMTGVINIYKQRSNKGIKPVKSNCKTCLYFNNRACKFNKPMKNRKHCIKYEYAEAPPTKKQATVISQQKAANKQLRNQESILAAKTTTFDKLSKFLGIDITYDDLQVRYKSYDKGYSIKIIKSEKLIIALRSTKTRQIFYYEII